IPTAISWCHGGSDVSVCTSVDGWNALVALSPRTGTKVEDSGEPTDWAGVLDLPPGTHRVKFRVDDEWRCSPDLLMALDEDGALVNYGRAERVKGKKGGTEVEGEKEVEEEAEEEEEDEETGYGQCVPEASFYKAPARGAPMAAASRPPVLPPHLANPLLNAAAPPSNVVDGEEGVLPQPVHAIIHHLYACSVRDGVVAVGTTARYKAK
ncbi:hypothetical protein BJ684DRAFT_4717, partial [Piptocephalis cylindrospora]